MTIENAPDDQHRPASKPVVEKHKAVRRRAVLVIHGVGEQRPMETLRGFLSAVVGDAPAVGLEEPLRIYSKPDSLAEGYELRRLVAATKNKRTDYYEFYWADLMPIAATNRLTAWYWMLLARPPKDVPSKFRIIWWISWAGLLIAAFLAAASIFAFFTTGDVRDSILPKLPWGLAIVLGALWLVVRAYAGDAAIYLSPSPRNVEARNRIRAAAVELLDKLHASERYECITIVGHSLGSVIGYDMLTYAWQRASDRQRDAVAGRPVDGGERQDPVRARAEPMAQAMTFPSISSTARATAETWQQSCAALLKEQRDGGLRWLVTDFITLGSPLAHGDLLLARNEQDFRRRVSESELPTAPPLLELGKYFSYPVSGKADGRVLHHAACFAVTRWTNLYFPSRWLLRGDFIAGAVAPLFGPGVLDIPVATRIWGGFLAHTHYWTEQKGKPAMPGDPVKVLRSVLFWP